MKLFFVQPIRLFALLTNINFKINALKKVFFALLFFVAFCYNAIGQTTFNASGTYSKPSGVTSIIVECWGGGGAGTKANNNFGGGGGGYSKVTYTVPTAASTYTITVGTGGAAEGGAGMLSSVVGASVTAVSNIANGGSGGNTGTGGTGITNSGGNGGNNGSNSGGGGGSSGGNTAALNGTNGLTGNPFTGGVGGVNTSGGNGGAGGTGNGSTGSTGISPGGGGGAGGGNSGTSGAGAAGRVIITEITCTPLTSISIGGAAALTQCVGANPTLSSTVAPMAASTPITYQWFLNGSPISGQTNSTYSPGALNTTGTYTYKVTALNCGGATLTSADKVFTIVADPISQTINPSPSTAIVCVGSNVSATFSGGSGGAGTISDNYEFSTNGGTSWASYTAGNNISATSVMVGSSIQIRTQKTATGTACGDGATNIYSWSVSPLTSITTQPSTATYCKDATATDLSVAASGTPTISYAWFSNTTNSNTGGTSVGTGATFTPPTSTVGSLWYYAVATSSACGAATSNAVEIKINPLTAITTQPTTATYCKDATATDLSVAASGTPTITYQWFSNTTNSNTGGTSVGTGATFTPPTSTVGSLWYYAVATSSVCNAATSNAVEIKINPLTAITTQPTTATYCKDATALDLSVAASGTPTITYQWFSNTTNSNTGGTSVGTGATFTPPTSTVGSLWYYAVATSSACGAATSNAVEIKINGIKNLTTGNCFSSIQAAVNIASNNDIIEILPGTYLENVIIDRNVSFQFTANNNATISNITVNATMELKNNLSFNVTTFTNNGIYTSKGFAGKMVNNGTVAPKQP